MDITKTRIRKIAIPGKQRFSTYSNFKPQKLQLQYSKFQHTLLIKNKKLIKKAEIDFLRINLFLVVSFKVFADETCHYLEFKLIYFKCCYIWYFKQNVFTIMEPHGKRSRVKGGQPFQV